MATGVVYVDEVGDTLKKTQHEAVTWQRELNREVHYFFENINHDVLQIFLFC